MFRSPVGFTALLLASFAVSELPAVAAGPAEGGQNSRTHKILGPARKAVNCRICAGANCTVVAVRGRCTKRAALGALELRLKRGSRRRMPLNPPVLDDRTYDDLASQDRSRVPAHTPEWMGPKSSDPGKTILETARRNPGSVRVQPVPGKPSFRPEVDDEVTVGFEHGDGGKKDK